MKTLIGRHEEQELLQDALESHEAEMVAVLGRRRVGKTFLINEVYGEQIVFEITGLQNATKQDQLENFVLQLAEAYNNPFPIKNPSSWLEAFSMLIQFLKTKIGEEKIIVFLDELPWLATHRSGFLKGMSYFWNSWAVKQNIVVVICGSAASWMIRKVVNNRGGLYNRITKRIQLFPFSLSETEEYFQSRNIHFDRYQIVQLYMALGGIPHYLKEVKGGKSATQNINRICFSKKGMLSSEFSRLYPALFAKAENHIKVIRALATKWQGLTRKEVNKIAKLPEGGTLARVLEELEHSGFISTYHTFGKKKKEQLYRLTDEYSLFYLQFIEGKVFDEKDIWNHLSQTQSYKTWSGYAFENLCLKHIAPIKKALGITGVYSVVSSFYKKGNATKSGTQIDLLIDRNDKVINLFEIKFYTDKFTVSKSYATTLRNKITVFREATKTKKQLFLVMISTYGVDDNMHSLGLIDQSLTLDDLFE
ncbi:MAG TPA: ATP-binding protein [Phaeodactylibacter sp.]|nr:ATP-binding protein [Phaeodactylibacter sp.]